jgi:sugar phosphate isomerase/epimerase
MKKPFTALQLYTVRDFTAQDTEGTLRKVKEMGYDYVELAGMYGLKAWELRKKLDDIGLNAISAHVQFKSLEENMAGTIADYKALGCKYIVIPMLAEELLPGGTGCAKQTLENFCTQCKKAGIIPAYHNHAFEFKKLPCGTFKLDKFFEDLPEMYAQLDTGWIKAAGQSPEAYIKKYSGRCPVIHIKDTIEVDEGFEDRPTGKGSQNIPSTIEAALAAGAAGFVVELDKAVGLTSLEAAKESRSYLSSLGY